MTVSGEGIQEIHEKWKDSPSDNYQHYGMVRKQSIQAEKHPSDQHFAIITKFVIWLHCLILP